MGNKLNPFEEEIKKAADNYQAPYSPAAWEKLSHELDITSSGNAIYKWGLSAIAVVAISLGGYFYLSNQTPSVEIAETEFVSENNIESKSPIVVIEESNNPISDVENESESVSEPIEEESIVVSDQGNKKEELVTEPVVEKVIEAKSEKKEVVSKKEKEVVPTKEFVMPEIIIDNMTLCTYVDVMTSLSTSIHENIVWDMGNGETVEGSEPSFQYTESGVYTVQAMLASDHSVKSNKLEVTVNPKPDATFTIYPNLERGVVPVVYFSANEGGEKYYQWNLGDGTSFSGEGTSHTYTKANDYEISLRVMNKYGCFQSSYQSHTIDKDYNLLATNGFSPDGDALNDDWMPFALTTGYYNFELVVFDRNQKQIFTTSDPDNKFTGLVNGSVAPSGEMFLWKAYVVDPTGTKHQYGGTIILIY